MQLQKTVVPFEKTNFFSKLFLDYINDGQGGKLSGFYTYQPSAEGIEKFVSNNAYNSLNRTLLVDELLAQNHELSITEASKKI